MSWSQSNDNMLIKKIEGQEKNVSNVFIFSMFFTLKSGSDSVTQKAYQSFIIPCKRF